MIDHASRPLYTKPNDYTPDLERYEKEWVPKIKAYNQALKNAIPEEYLAPVDLVPEDLDSTYFNATEIPYKVLDKETLAITELSATEIAAKIMSKDLTAVQALTAFFKRAVLAHQFTHCILEVVFDEGLERAKFLDKYYEEKGELFGPLHGIPLSLKEHYAFKGHVTHAGYVSNLDNVTPQFSETCQTLYDLGAVFYVRTNEPQSLMHADSINNISSRCKNAFNTAASPGGSSSGEGAILGMKGSPLGLGSDIGGSVRFPAAFNNAWALKPSSKRISMLGCVSSYDDTYNEGIEAVLGPMSNSVKDLGLFMNAYLSTEPWKKDQHLIPLPWRDVPTPKAKQLTIGLYFDDGVCKPHPPVIRALEEAEAKLKAAGMKVVVWTPHRVYEITEIASCLYVADGNNAAVSKLKASGEPLADLTTYFLGIGQGGKGLTTVENQEYAYQREVLRQEYLELFNSRGVDFLITPTYVGCAPKPTTIKYWSYTSTWNLLDFTCVTFPSGVFADKNIDLKDEAYTPRNEVELREYGQYDPMFTHGLPVGLTLVGRRYTEEECLKGAELVHSLLTQ